MASIHREADKQTWQHVQVKHRTEGEYIGEEEEEKEEDQDKVKDEEEEDKEEESFHVSLSPQQRLLFLLCGFCLFCPFQREKGDVWSDLEAHVGPNTAGASQTYSDLRHGWERERGPQDVI